MSARVFKNIHKLPISARNLRYGALARDLLRPQINEWIPETGPAHRKTDEPRDAGRRHQPFAHLVVIFASAQNNATYFIPVASPRRCHNLLAVLTAVESLDLPHIRFNPRVLQLLNGLNHQSGAKLQVVLLLISLNPIELRLLRRNQQFKHESTATLVAQVLG